MQKQNLGFDKEQVLVLRAPRVRDSTFQSKVNTLKQELLKNAAIKKVCVATEVPGRQIYWDAGGIFPVGSDESKNYQIVGIDYDFVDLFQTEIIEGRNFSPEFPSDTVGLILNETAVKWMGFPTAKSAIGEKINYWDVIYTVVGVMKDYHQQSPKAAFEPHLYRFMPYGRDKRGVFVLKLNTQNYTQTLDAVRKKYTEFFPNNPLDFFFLDDYYKQQYKADEFVGNIFGIFSFLALFVTAMGLFGLFSFIVLQRTKEICVRSILGAETLQIVYLFVKDVFVLVLISFLLTLPLTYFGITRWLESFASRMTLSIWIFVLPLLVVLVISVLTIGSQVVKATRTNPAENLRYE